jgi:hypothetical protein
VHFIRVGRCQGTDAETSRKDGQQIRSPHNAPVLVIGDFICSHFFDFDQMGRDKKAKDNVFIIHTDTAFSSLYQILDEGALRRRNRKRLTYDKESSLYLHN